MTIDAAILQLDKVPKNKGEYETGAQFAARGAAARPPGPLIVSAPIDLHYVRYDADAQMLNVSLYALDNHNVSYDDVVGYGTPYAGRVKYGALKNIDVVISEHGGATGNYIGGNAMGARVRVTKVTRTIKAIFDCAAVQGHSDLFNNNGAEHIIGGVAISPAAARLRKPRLSAAFVIYPKWPFVALGTKNWGPATIDNPDDVRPRITALVADIQCALVMDGGKVVLAFATRRGAER